jgi:hypothetical protein
MNFKSFIKFEYSMALMQIIDLNQKCSVRYFIIVSYNCSSISWVGSMSQVFSLSHLVDMAPYQGIKMLPMFHVCVF